MRLSPLSSSFTRKVDVVLKSLAATVFALVVFISAAYFITGEAWAQSLPGGSNGADVIACSPAPCVLPPTNATQGRNAVSAPIVADPADRAHLIVGSQAVCGQSGLAFWVTTDAGSTWSETCMSPITYEGNEYAPDGATLTGPNLGYDRHGNAYIAGFYAYDGSGNPEPGFQGFQKYTAGGGWSAPAVALIDKGEPFDPWYCWLSVDTNGASPYADSVYISCVLVGPLTYDNETQAVVSHSNDGGATWQQVAVAPLHHYPEYDASTAMAVGKDGTVYLTWQYSDSKTFGPSDVVFSKSSDGGNTWSKPAVVAPVTQIYYVPNTGDLSVLDTPAIAVDNSDGSHAGNLYVVMYNWTGTFMQVQVVRSADGGDTWSRPVPVAPPSDTHDQFLPWISVGPTGLVGVSWLDRRNDPANVDYQAFAGISANGGLSFENVQLTTGFSSLNNQYDGSQIGSYTGDTWDGPNYFIAAWMDDSNGQYMEDYVGGIRLK
jgi:hypothetical protein